MIKNRYATLKIHTRCMVMMAADLQFPNYICCAINIVTTINILTNQTNPPFGETILVIFDHFKQFENGLENGLTLQILRWYKWLRFKDIVQEFGKLKKMVEKSGMK